MATYYVDGAVGSDSNAGTSAGAGNAWATIGHALATIGSGDLVYVKASATYSISAGLSAATGSYNDVTRLVGYATTPGDGGMATVQAAAGSITMLSITATGQFTVENVTFDGNSQASVLGISIAGTYSNGALNCKVENCTNGGIACSGGVSSKVIGCEVTGCSGGSGGAVYMNCAGTVFANNVHDNTVTGIYCTGQNLYSIAFNRVWNNTGSTSDGIHAQEPYSIRNNTIHGNGRHGIDLGFQINNGIFNNLITSNGGYGINAGGLSAAKVDPACDYNWFGSGSMANTSGARNLISAGPHDLSGDPGYTNAAAGDFTPTNSALQAGYP